MLQPSSLVGLVYDQGVWLGVGTGMNFIHTAYLRKGTMYFRGKVGLYNGASTKKCSPEKQKEEPPLEV